MAARHRQGLAHYRPASAASTFRAKRGPSPTSKVGRRRAAASAARGRVARPGSKLGDRRKVATLGAQSSWPEEWRWLHRQALAEALDRSIPAGQGPYTVEWRELVDREYRSRYNAQARTRRAAKPKAKGPWVRVRSYRRRRPAH